MTPDDKRDIAYFLQQFPDYRIQAGPVMTSIDGQPFVSLMSSVWIWKDEDVAGTAKLYTGESIKQAIGEALAELGGRGGLTEELEDYYRRQW